MNRALGYLLLGVGLVAGQFIWQVITDCRWGVAAERSWFAVLGLLSAAITLR